MEANSLFSPFFFITLFLGFFITILIMRSRSRVHKQRAQVVLAPLPPGPPRLPLIGNIHQLVGGNSQRILLQLARTYGPLICLQLGQVNLVVALSVEAVEEIIKRHDLKFADRPRDVAFFRILFYNGSGLSMVPYGGNWKQMRKIYAMELLNSRCVKSYTTIRVDAVRKLTAEIARKAFAETPVINLSQMAMSMINAIVIRVAFGDKCKQQAEFLLLVKEAFSYMSNFAVTDMYPSLKFFDTLMGLKSKLEGVRGKIDKVFDEIIAQRQVALAAEPAEEDLIIDVLCLGPFADDATDKQRLVHQKYLAASELLFDEQARSKRFEVSKLLFRSRMQEGTFAIQHVLKMYEYRERLGSLDFAMEHELSIDLILHSLPDSYSYFVMNYRMNRIESTIPDMINMLKIIELVVKNEKKTVMLVDSSMKGFKRKSTRQAKWEKKVNVTEPASKGQCHHCDKMGHWRRNCKSYLESMKGKKACDTPSASDIFVIECHTISLDT
ncbi:alpha-humulene 10-hydroxylase-like [Curcuma longa]|uniref:alpha-humulene 10-hydroxylase-like n=1 Tax=Curcuma longa TaxID=136217 RepID=UPI003D9F4FCB